MPLRVGDTAEKTKRITEADIRAFATISEDFNPLHHDVEFAKTTRYGDLIACGPHYASLLMGLMATTFSQHGPMVGIDFTLIFTHPVRPGDKIALRWVVEQIEAKSTGNIITCAGSVTNQDGVLVLSSVGKLMAFHS